MRKAILTGVLMSALAATTAYAADAVVAPEAAPVAPVAQGTDWTGLYLGIQLGGQWTDATVDIPAYPSNFSNDTSGFVGGGYVGYNFQLTPSIVAGVEADGNWMDISATALSGGGGGETYTIEQDWDASVRGRLGYSTGQALLYLTGGVAFTNLETFYTPIAGGTDSDTLTGWNVGAGGEYMFTQNIAGRVQYLYTDFGTGNFTHLGASSVDYKTHKVQAGLSWRFSWP
ncbi:outer membrane protein [Nitratireductor sp. XY-223]|uniref:outer membrane protein n=1 Tax=Nitratireductor sp. XY-223 TaxID=2561926 RepID=UPI0010AA6B92|nr:outer membrane protein [Nitratireductor sp. XY-223]